MHRSLHGDWRLEERTLDGQRLDGRRLDGQRLDGRRPSFRPSAIIVGSNGARRDGVHKGTGRRPSSFSTSGGSSMPCCLVLPPTRLGRRREALSGWRAHRDPSTALRRPRRFEPSVDILVVNSQFCARAAALEVDAHPGDSAFALLGAAQPQHFAEEGHEKTIRCSRPRSARRLQLSSHRGRVLPKARSPRCRASTRLRAKRASSTWRPRSSPR